MKRRSFVGALAALVALPKALMGMKPSQPVVGYVRQGQGPYPGQVGRKGHRIEAWADFNGQRFPVHEATVDMSFGVQREVIESLQSSDLYDYATTRCEFSILKSRLAFVGKLGPHVRVGLNPNNVVYEGKVIDCIDDGDTVRFKCGGMPERLARVERPAIWMESNGESIDIMRL